MSRTYRKQRPRLNKTRHEPIVRDGSRQYFASSCEHHGDCPHCKGNRTYSSRHRVPLQDRAPYYREYYDEYNYLDDITAFFNGSPTDRDILQYTNTKGFALYIKEYNHTEQLGIFDTMKEAILHMTNLIATDTKDMYTNLTWLIDTLEPFKERKTFCMAL